MLSLLLFANLTALATDAGANDDTERCRTRIASRLGELGTFSPVSSASRGGRTVVSGVADSLKKAPPAASGMMAPTHVLVTRYSFRCELRSGVVKRLTLRRRGN